MLTHSSYTDIRRQPRGCLRDVLRRPEATVKAFAKRVVSSKTKEENLKDYYMPSSKGDFEFANISYLLS